MEDEVSFDDQDNQWFELSVSDEIQFDDFLNETYIFWSNGSKKFIYSDQFLDYPENYFKGDYVDLSFYSLNIDPYWAELFYQYMILRDSGAIIPDSFEYFKKVIIRSNENWIELGEPIPYYILPTTLIRIVKDNVKKHSFHYVKKSEGEKTNAIKVEYVNRRQRYKIDVLEEANSYSIEEEKVIREQSFKLHGIKRTSQATRLTAHYHDYEQFVNYRIVLETDTLAYFLRVGNIIGIVEDIMGWDGKEFRITKIDETEFGTNRIEAEEYIRSIYHDYSCPYPLPPDFEYNQGGIPRYLTINQVERFRVYKDKQLCRIYFMMKPGSTDSGEDDEFFSGAFIYRADSLIEDDAPSLTEYESINGIINSTPPSVAITSIEDNYVNYDLSTMYSSFPNSGILIIDDEEIYYSELDELMYRFSGIIRGFNGTEVQDHEIGSFAYLRTTDLYYINYGVDDLNKYHWFRALAVNVRGMVPTTGIVPWDTEFIDALCDRPLSVSSLKVTYIGDIEESSSVNNYPRTLEDGIFFNDILSSDLVPDIEVITESISFDDNIVLESDTPELVSDGISFDEILEFYEFLYLEDNINFNDDLFHTDEAPIEETLADEIGFNDIVDSTIPNEYLGDFVVFNDNIFIELILDSLNYYVSSTDGDDSNTGTSIASPWKTLSYASSLALDPGSVINMKKGDIWQMSDVLPIVNGGVSGEYITWNGAPDWGSGDNATIKNTSNRSKGNLAIVNIISCKYLKFKDIIVDGDNYNADAGVIIGGNKDASKRNQNDERFITLDGILVKNMGSDTSSTGIIAQTWFNPIYDIQILNSTVDGVMGHGIAIYPGKTQSGASGSEIFNTRIKNCIVTNFNTGDAATGYGIHLSNRTYNAIVEHCAIMQGINGRGVSGIFIERNDKRSINFPLGLSIRNNIISDIMDWGVWIKRAQAVTVDFYNNLIFNNGGPETSWGGGVRIDSDDYTGATFNFYNNTFYNNGFNAPEGRGLNFYISEGVTGSPLVNFRNNLIHVTNVLGIDCQVAGLLTHSNNNVFRSDGGNIIRNGYNYYTNLDAINWESTIQVGDPLLADTSQLPTGITSFVGPNTDGLNTQVGSPARNNGATIHLFNTSINNVQRSTGVWDIGAYENG
jgi:hypothetical protein